MEVSSRKGELVLKKEDGVLREVDISVYDSPKPLRDVKRVKNKIDGRQRERDKQTDA